MRYRHKKSGGDYEIVAEAQMQTKTCHTASAVTASILEAVQLVSVDMEDVVVYRSLEDNRVWVRPYADFFERFELV